MSDTVTFRVHKSLANWLQEKSVRMGISQGRFIREHLEHVRRGDKRTQGFMRLAGSIRRGPRDLSTRKGFARK